MTIATENAAAFATTDRDEAATRVLNSAVREVCAAYRLALRLGVSPPVTEAAAELERARLSAGRMLGDGRE